MKKALFIYNPVSGDGEIKRKIDKIIYEFNKRGIFVFPYRIDETSKIDLPNVLKEINYDEIFIAGGDGTINRCVNQIMAIKIDVPIGVIPAGTVNDFSASLGITGNYIKGLESILDNNKTKRMDIGYINNGHYFVATLAGGLFVDVSYKTSSDLKKAFGPSAYYIKGMTEVANKRAFNIKIETENEIIEEKALLFFVTNGKHAAGFSQIVDDVLLDDGMMDLVIIKDCPGVELFGLFLKALKNNLLDDKNVIRIKANRFIVSADADFKLSIDGEEACSLPVTVNVLEKRLNFYYL